MPESMAAVLAAVVLLEWPTVRAVGELAGLSSTSTVHHWLRRLRDAGLVTWEPGKSGTLRATVTPLTLSGRSPVTATMAS